MSQLPIPEPHRRTMDRLEAIKHLSDDGTEYWSARELGPVLGYPVWQNFESVISRAVDALRSSGKEPSHHIMPAHKNTGRPGRDYFLSRAGSYLIAMNGEPAKVEIAAAQVYFAARVRQAELIESLAQDEKRLKLREKVSDSMKRVSGVAQAAGVPNQRQGRFHEQRYRGLYNASSVTVKVSKGLSPSDNLFDRAGPLELSAHDFQMNLAADIISKEHINGEQAAVDKNLQVAQRVRLTIKQSGGTLPEDLRLQEHIKEVRQRVTGRRTKALTSPKKPHT